MENKIKHLQNEHDTTVSNYEKYIKMYQDQKNV